MVFYIKNDLTITETRYEKHFYDTRRDVGRAFQKSASHIVVDVEFGEGEGQISLKEAKESAEEQKPIKKTTYKDIQRYVEENYDFKVHTALKHFEITSNHLKSKRKSSAFLFI